MTKIMLALLGVCLSTVTVAADLNKAVEANNQFGADLYQAIRKSENNKASNRFISPTSAYLALSLLANGARNETEKAILSTLRATQLTREELNSANRGLIKALVKPSKEKNAVELAIANSVWTDKSFRLRDRFISDVKESYGSEARELDFKSPEAAKTINDWVLDKTSGKIKDFIKSTDGASMYLVNATYFRGPWTNPFSPKLTQPGRFYTSATEVKEVPMMRNSFIGAYAKTDDYEVVQMNYGAYESRLLLVLPKGDIATLESKVNSSFLAELSDKLAKPGSSHQIDLKLPRFKFEYESDLAQPLVNLGMEIAFGPLADFFDMAAGQVAVSKAFQKTFLAMDEVGTEAAAATGIGMVTSVPMVPKASIEFNRPFFTVIQDTKTQAILFLGSVVNP